MSSRRFILVGAVLVSLVLIAMGSVSVAAAATSWVVSSPNVTAGTSVNSTNWAGYAVQDSSKFTEVVGTWVEPAIVGTCPTAAHYASFWVGIDGYSSSTVEQLGTDSDCSGGSPQYYGWYEMYPASSVNLGSKYPVHAGDHLTGEVHVSGATFMLSLKDATAGWTFSISKTGSGLQQSSAEWIAESPEICSPSCSLAKLADFGVVSFTHCEAAVGGGAPQPISAFTASGSPHKLTMVNSTHTKVRALPSKLGTTGETFTVRWKSA